MFSRRHLTVPVHVQTLQSRGRRKKGVSVPPLLLKTMADARPRKRSGKSSRIRHQRLLQAREIKRREQQEQVSRWLDQFDTNHSGRLERDELSALLRHLHPECGQPDARALDLLLMLATEIKTYSLHIKGNPNGSVGPDMLMPIVSGYATYLLASEVFENGALGSVVRLCDLPGLMRDANKGVDCDKSDVDFVFDCAASSIGGQIDSESTVSREELQSMIPTFAAWKLSQQMGAELDALQEMANEGDGALPDEPSPEEVAVPEDEDEDEAFDNNDEPPLEETPPGVRVRRSPLPAPSAWESAATGGRSRVLPPPYVYERRTRMSPPSRPGSASFRSRPSSASFRPSSASFRPSSASFRPSSSSSTSTVTKSEACAIL